MMTAHRLATGGYGIPPTVWRRVATMGTDRQVIIDEFIPVCARIYVLR
jgi:hypothetical protein